MDYEIYPIVHKNMIFNIITNEDLTFDDTDTILDELIEMGAFENIDFEEPGRSYKILNNAISCFVEVYGYEVFVYNMKRLIEQEKKE